MTRISPELLSQVDTVLQHLDSGTVPQEVLNRRRQPRTKLRLSVEVILLHGGGMPVPIWTRNLSPSGVGFVSRRSFQVGERFALPIDFRGLRRRLILAKVTFCRYLRNGFCESGAEFVEAATECDRIPPQWFQVHHAAIPRAKAKV